MSPCDMSSRSEARNQMRAEYPNSTIVPRLCACRPITFLTVNCLLALLATLSVSNAVEPVGDIFMSEMCVDHKGEKVGPGERYFPMGTDRCTECTCINGKSEMCISVFCSPPENCRQPHELNDKCCEFVCLDGDLDRPTSNHNNTVLKTNESEAINATNLGLRLVASTVTSFLILALLLFMIHRLRQRRLLLMIRRIQSRRMQAAGNHLSRRLSLEDDGSVGYFVGHDQIDFAHYSDPPPPYMFWKPPEAYMPPGEAPPPYEASIGAPYNTFYALLNGTLVDVTRNDGTSTYPTVGSVLSSQSQMMIPNSSNHQHHHHTSPPTPPKRVEDRGTQAPPPLLPAVVQLQAVKAADQSVQSFQLSHSESTSTVSMRSDNETNTVAMTTTAVTTNETAAAAIASDAQYEDLPSSYLATNVTVLRVGDGANLRDEDLVNGNVYVPSGTAVKEICGSVPTQVQTHRVTVPPCVCGGNARNGNSDSRTSNVNCRHSFGDFADYWQNQSVPPSNRRPGGELRRHGVRVSSAGGHDDSNEEFYPDPTTWGSGEGSESSSSSSPTYEQPTPSPSSSDSSSMDVDFEPAPDSSCRGADRTSKRTSSSSIDKKLLQLKKFSLPHSRKKKADKVTQVEEMQIRMTSGGNRSHATTLGCTNVAAVGGPRIFHPAAFCNELRGARASLRPVFTVEAIDRAAFDGRHHLHSKANEPLRRDDDSRSRGWSQQIPHVTLRPTTLPLPPEDAERRECSSSTCSCGTCVPVSPPAIDVHSGATATISQLNLGSGCEPAPPRPTRSGGTPGSDPSVDGVEAYITQQQTIHLPVAQSRSHPGCSDSSTVVVKSKASVSAVPCNASAGHVAALHSRRTKSDVGAIKEILLREHCKVDDGYEGSGAVAAAVVASYSDTECRESDVSGRSEHQGRSSGGNRSARLSGKTKSTTAYKRPSVTKNESSAEPWERHSDGESVRGEFKSTAASVCGERLSRRTEESSSHIKTKTQFQGCGSREPPQRP